MKKQCVRLPRVGDMFLAVFNARYAVVWLAGILIVYLGVQLATLNFPGGEFDEMFPLLNAMRIIESCGRHSLVGYFISGFSNHEYLTMNSCHGALESFLLLPILYVFGASVPVMRLLPVFAGCAMVALIYSLVKRIHGPWAALGAAFMSAFSPTFMLMSKYGLGNSGIILPGMYMAALILFYKWYRNEGAGFLYLGVFISGLGLWGRVWFAWFIAGMVGSACVFNREIRAKLRLSVLAWCSLIFTAGALPVLIHEYFSNHAVVQALISGFINPSDNHHNALYLINLPKVLENFNAIVSDGFATSELLGYRLSRPYNVVIFWGAFIYLSVRSLAMNDLRVKKMIRFLLVLFSIMFLVTPLSHSSLPWYHFVFFLPLIFMIIVCALYNIFSYVRGSKPVLAVFVCGICSLAFLQVKAAAKTVRMLVEFEGNGFTSSAIYKLCDWLQSGKYQKVICCDFGFQRLIRCVSGGKLNEAEYKYSHFNNYACADAERIRNDFMGALKDDLTSGEHNAYIIYDDAFSTRKDFPPGMSQYDTLKTVAAECGAVLKEVKQFSQKDGRVIYHVFECE